MSPLIHIIGRQIKKEGVTDIMNDDNKIEISQSTYDSLIRADNVLLIINLYLERCKEKKEAVDYKFIDILNEALM